MRLQRLRNHYYDSWRMRQAWISSLPSALKSSLMKAQEALGTPPLGLVNKDVIANEHKGAGQAGGCLRRWQQDQQGRHSRRWICGGENTRHAAGTNAPPAKDRFSDLAQASSTTARSLDSTTGTAKAPGNIPGNADYGDRAQLRHSSTGPAQSLERDPRPSARQFPAQAGREGQGIPPAPPSSPPPPLNEPTAVTNVNAGTPRPAQEAIPQRTIHVDPEGHAAIQRPLCRRQQSRWIGQQLRRFTTAQVEIQKRLGN